jgi:hypothetical protein
MAPTAAITGMALLDGLPMSARRLLSAKPDIGADMAAGPSMTRFGHQAPLFVATHSTDDLLYLV